MICNAEGYVGDIPMQQCIGFSPALTDLLTACPGFATEVVEFRECGKKPPLRKVRFHNASNDGLGSSISKLRNLATWLILPVVICLSQRLSHACVGITCIPVNCEWLGKSVIVYLIVQPTRITVVTLELIRA